MWYSCFTGVSFVAGPGCANLTYMCSALLLTHLYKNLYHCYVNLLHLQKICIQLSESDCSDVVQERSSQKYLSHSF